MATGGIFEVTRVPAHDPDERYAMVGELVDAEDPTKHPLDNEVNTALFRRIWTWLKETEDAWAPNRLLRLRDHEFRDGRQWTPEEEAALRARGQEPLVFNQIKLMIDWIIGTERRTRIDWNVLPRAEDDVERAQLKKQLLKYVSDVNRLGWQRSLAFADAAISGLGWLEDCVTSAPDEEPCTSRYQDWRGMWHDFYSRDPSLKDCRFIFRKKYLDIDYAEAMFPERIDLLRSCARTTLAPGLELVEEDGIMPALFAGSQATAQRLNAAFLGRARERVPVWECWYREPKRVKRLTSMLGDYSPLNDAVFDETNPDHVAAKANPLYTLTEGVAEGMKVAFFCEKGLLEVKDSPYKHKQFPFTPVWGYRDSLDGTPYGAVRQAIDPQRDYNKRRSKSLHLLTTNQVIYEDGALLEDGEDEFFEEAARPDGRMRVRNGALTGKRIELRSNTELAASHFQIMQEDKENILEVSGVTRENVGQSSNAVSGKAILAKQQQGAVSTAELFDNLRLSVQLSGEKQLSNIEQFMSMPKQFRILGPDGANKWVMVNRPEFDPLTGLVRFENDITEHAADFVVDQQDYRETIRMAQSETMFELVGSIASSAPDVALSLLPFALELTDVPNKQAMLNVVREKLGLPPAGEENSADAQAAREAKQADAEAQKQLERAAMAADTRLKHARASRDEAAATREAIQGKRDALDAASIASAALPVVPAADRLYEGSKPPTQ